MNPPPWYWYATDILKSITPILIGAGVVWIAHRQAVIARNKLKFDLFDRRFRVFLATKKLFEFPDVDLDAKPSAEEALVFEGAIAEAAFLFDAELVDYLRSIRDRAGYLRGLTAYLERAESLEDAERYEIIAGQEKQILAALKVAEAEVVRRFRPYLDLRLVR